MTDIQTGEQGPAGRLRRLDVKYVLLLLAIAALIAISAIMWNGDVTGYHSLQTLESEYFVAGSSADKSLSFERIPDFVARVGEDVSFSVNPNKEDVIFRDDSRLFDITQDGEIEFTPSENDVGKHNAWIIIKDITGSYYYQNVAITIEE